MSRQRKQTGTQVCFAAVAVAALGAVPIITAPAAAQKVPVLEALGRFTFTPPAGWQLTTAPAPYRLRCIANPRDDDSATLSVQETASPLSLARYVQKLLRTMRAAAPQARLLSRGPFVTASGLHGYRAVLDQAAAGQSVHFALYAFPGAGGRKFLVAGIWPASENARYESAADAAMKTFMVK